MWNLREKIHTQAHRYGEMIGEVVKVGVDWR